MIYCISDETYEFRTEPGLPPAAPDSLLYWVSATKILYNKFLQQRRQCHTFDLDMNARRRKGKGRLWCRRHEMSLSLSDYLDRKEEQQADPPSTSKAVKLDKKEPLLPNWCRTATHPYSHAIGKIGFQWKRNPSGLRFGEMEHDSFPFGRPKLKRYVEGDIFLCSNHAPALLNLIHELVEEIWNCQLICQYAGFDCKNGFLPTYDIQNMLCGTTAKTLWPIFKQLGCSQDPQTKAIYLHRDHIPWKDDCLEPDDTAYTSHGQALEELLLKGCGMRSARPQQLLRDLPPWIWPDLGLQQAPLITMMERCVEHNLGVCFVVLDQQPKWE